MLPPRVGGEPGLSAYFSRLDASIVPIRYPYDCSSCRCSDFLEVGSITRVHFARCFMHRVARTQTVGFSNSHLPAPSLSVRVLCSRSRHRLLGSGVPNGFI